MLRPRPAAAIALFQQGNQQLEDKQPDAAEASFREALAQQPHFPQAHAHLGFVLHERGDLVGAEPHYRKALELASGLTGVYLNLGALLTQQKRLYEAEAIFAQALAQEPTNSRVWTNLGSLYLGLQKYDDAEACLRRAIALDTNHSHKARFNLAYLQLRRGNFEEGWTLFEARDWYAAMERHFQFPRWRGEALNGKSMVLCFEAGHGDVIQFCRYAKQVRARGTRHITLICHPALERLMRSLADVDEVIPFTGAVPATGHDYWMPLMSAPYLLRAPASATTESTLQTHGIYAELPYLHAEPGLRTQWAAQLPRSGFRVGLAWRGNPKFENDLDRSLPSLHTLLPLWDVAGIELISLQKGPGEDDAVAFAAHHPLHCLGHTLNDFADSAAVLSQIDLLISVDTAMAHLAGALGTPCWLLLPDYMTDWRWREHGTESDWYPGVLRLFRQDARRDWGPVVAALVQALQHTVTATTATAAATVVPLGTPT